jgi:uncharacterized protein (DUF1697 family)
MNPAMPQHVALLRGINVGKAKRVAMADLRQLLADLGYKHIHTLLNSGNALFDADDLTPPADHAARIETALHATLGVSARVIVLPGDSLRAAVAENPLRTAADANPSAFLMGFVPDRDALSALVPHAVIDWSPEALAIGRHAVYIDCHGAILASRLLPAVTRTLADHALTTRNWATILKLDTLLAATSS